MADDTTYSRRSPFGIALLVVGVLTVLVIVFLLTQRGGEVTGDVGADGINPNPEQTEVEEVLDIEEETPALDPAPATELVD
jgi:hypothetical protein